MNVRRPTSAAEQLADEVVLLRQEVAVLRETMDEIRECFEWALHNGQAIPVPLPREESQLRKETEVPPSATPAGEQRQDSLFT